MEIIAGCVLLLTIALIFGRRAAANVVIGGLYLAGGIIVLLAVGLGFWLAFRGYEHAALENKIRQDIRTHAPDRNFKETWASELANGMQDRHLSDQEIDDEVKQDLKAAGVTPDQKETQQELEEDLRKLPPDEMELFTNFLQRPEAEQQQILAKLDEHSRALIEEFKVRQQLLKGLSTPSQN